MTPESESAPPQPKGVRSGTQRCGRPGGWLWGSRPEYMCCSPRPKQSRHTFKPEAARYPFLVRMTFSPKEDIAAHSLVLWVTPL